MISDGLLWVFVAMFCIALIGIAVSCLMPKRKVDHPVRRAECLEAMAG
jgi:hypothetical protein